MTGMPPARPLEPRFVDLPPREAAPRLGLTLQALWARLRRSEDAKRRADLGGGIVAYRLGARSWRVRFPLDL
jgi:hypothetical protein